MFGLAVSTVIPHCDPSRAFLGGLVMRCCDDPKPWTCMGFGEVRVEVLGNPKGRGHLRTFGISERPGRLNVKQALEP